MDASLIHSHEKSPLYNIAMFYSIVVSIISMGFIPNMFPIICSVCPHGGVRKNDMNVYNFHSAGDYCTAESEKGDTGVTVSVGSVFSFYGVEDYCMCSRACHGGLCGWVSGPTTT